MLAALALVGSCARRRRCAAARDELGGARRLGGHGLDRGLFVASPGGVFATAARVAQSRPLVERRARQRHRSESARGDGARRELRCARDAVDGSAAGLAQISAGVAKHRLGAATSACRLRATALTRRIDRADARGAFTTARQLSRWRAPLRRALRPATSLRATARYLRSARRRSAATISQSPRTTWGSAGSRLRSLRTAGRKPPTYAQLYFGSAPDVHARAWRLLAAVATTTGRCSPRSACCGSTGTIRRGARVRGAAASAEELRRGGAAPRVSDAALHVAAAIARRGGGTCCVRSRAMRTGRTSRSRVLRRRGAQARPFTAALSRTASRDARRAALHRLARARAFGRAQAAHPHERAARQPLPAGAAARERERGADVLDPHDGLRVRHRRARMRARGRRRPSSSCSTGSSPRTRSRISGRRAAIHVAVASDARRIALLARAR